MSNTPDNIRNMWEQAANGANPYPSQGSPGMGSGIKPPTRGELEQLRKPKGDAGAIGPQGPQGAAGAGGAVGRTKKKD